MTRILENICEHLVLFPKIGIISINLANGTSPTSGCSGESLWLKFLTVSKYLQNHSKTLCWQNKFTRIDKENLSIDLHQHPTCNFEQCESLWGQMLLDMNKSRAVKKKKRRRRFRNYTASTNRTTWDWNVKWLVSHYSLMHTNAVLLHIISTLRPWKDQKDLGHPNGAIIKTQHEIHHRSTPVRSQGHLWDMPSFLKAICGHRGPI